MLQASCASRGVVCCRYQGCGDAAVLTDLLSLLQVGDATVPFRPEWDRHRCAHGSQRSQQQAQQQRSFRQTDSSDNSSNMMQSTPPAVQQQCAEILSAVQSSIVAVEHPHAPCYAATVDKLFLLLALLPLLSLLPRRHPQADAAPHGLPARC